MKNYGDKEEQGTMKKTVAIVLALLLVFGASLAFAGGTKEAAPSGKAMAEESKTGGEAAGGAYERFEMYRGYAEKEEAYPGSPDLSARYWSLSAHLKLLRSWSCSLPWE